MGRKGKNANRHLDQQQATNNPTDSRRSHHLNKGRPDIKPKAYHTTKKKRFPDDTRVIAQTGSNDLVQSTIVPSDPLTTTSRSKGYTSPSNTIITSSVEISPDNTFQSEIMSSVTSDKNGCVNGTDQCSLHLDAKTPVHTDGDDHIQVEPQPHTKNIVLKTKSYLMSQNKHFRERDNKHKENVEKILSKLSHMSAERKWFSDRLTGLCKEMHNNNSNANGHAGNSVITDQPKISPSPISTQTSSQSSSTIRSIIEELSGTIPTLYILFSSLVTLCIVQGLITCSAINVAPISYWSLLLSYLLARFSRLMRVLRDSEARFETPKTFNVGIRFTDLYNDAQTRKRYPAFSFKFLTYAISTKYNRSKLRLLHLQHVFQSIITMPLDLVIQCLADYYSVCLLLIFNYLTIVELIDYTIKPLTEAINRQVESYFDMTDKHLTDEHDSGVKVLPHRFGQLNHRQLLGDFVIRFIDILNVIVNMLIRVIEIAARPLLHTFGIVCPESALRIHKCVTHHALFPSILPNDNHSRDRHVDDDTLDRVDWTSAYLKP